MDVNNETIEQIKSQLRRLKCIQISYFIVKVIYSFLVAAVENVFNGEESSQMTSTVEFAITKLILNNLSLLIFIPVHVYLICMGIEM